MVNFNLFDIGILDLGVIGIGIATLWAVFRNPKAVNILLLLLFFMIILKLIIE